MTNKKWTCPWCHRPVFGETDRWHQYVSTSATTITCLRTRI